MSLPAGTRLGAYEIIEVIGTGGMGEVYKARDPRLNRTVAIKVLLDRVSTSAEARARFEREAQTIAGLNHPHICVVYDVGRHENTDFLVMELLDGETLARRLEKGPLPLNQALQYAVEIADALDKAHQHRVTHRDLKPGNIMLTTTGVKLLDFGLAKLRPAQNISTLSEAATKAEITAEGTIIGSLQYMAPEQLEGSDADARTDIFAFGVVLYEMVTGRKAFEGKSAVSLMSAIFKDTPTPVTSWQTVAPDTLDQAITSCLAKNPEDRWQSARDMRRELKRIAETIAKGSKETLTQTKAHSPPWLGGGRTAIRLGFAAALVAAGALITATGFWMLSPKAREASSGVVRLSVPLQPGEELRSFMGPPIALSPDGSLLAFASVRRGRPPLLYLRRMNSSETEAVSGSDGAANPFFSADGKWVGFFASGKLKRVAVAGGVVETVCDASSNLGGSWDADDTIYFAVSSGISKVSAAGGTPEVVTTLDRAKGEVSHRWPQILPGGKALLLTVWTGPGWDETQLQLLDLKTGNRHLIVPGARTGYYATSGHLVYFRQGVDALMSVPFDLDRLQVGSGPPITLAERVRDTSEGGEYALSSSGMLAYIPSTPQMYESRLVWVNRDGTTDPLPVRPQAYMEPVLSPDGKQFAISVAGPAYTLSIYDFDREVLTPLRANGSSQAPGWTARGKRIIYRGTRKGTRNLYERNADGSDDEKQLATGEVTQTPTSVSSNGSEVTFDMGGDVWMLTLESDFKSAPILKTPFREGNAHQSPDGRWMAYVSDESGINEIYVRPKASANGKWKISADGGTEPVWSRDSRELFYRAGDKMMAVTVSTGQTFSASVPKVVFTGRYQFSGTGVSGYDVSLDGRRFLMVQQTEAAQPATQIDIVLNWIEQLRVDVPVRKD